MPSVELLSEERLDDLQRNGYQIIQNPNKFCFGIDAVLLSGYAKVKENEVAIDLGTGTGIIPILLEAKTEGKYFTGLEIQQDMADMASRSVLYNKLENKIRIIEGDINNASSIFGLSSFDVVTCNPPYMNDNHGLKNPELPKAIARHEVLCTLEDVIRESSRLLKSNGRLYMIHRPHRLVEIFEVMRKYKLEPKKMQLVYPFIDKEPNMVLIEAIRSGKPMLKIDKPLIVYREAGVYMDEIFGF